MTESGEVEKDLAFVTVEISDRLGIFRNVNVQNNQNWPMVVLSCIESSFGWNELYRWSFSHQHWIGRQ
jgi:hypothetical protein